MKGRQQRSKRRRVIGIERNGKAGGMGVPSAAEPRGDGGHVRTLLA
jgi:hypothetical protein